MVKGIDFPLLCIVTPLTVCSAILIKLTVMVIGMAGLAIRIQGSEFPIRCPIRLIWSVATPAWLKLMFAGKGKRCLIMIEGNLCPGCLLMAGFTRGIRVVGS